MTDEELLAIEDAVATLAQSRNLNDDESDAIDSLRASAPRLLAEVWRLRDEVARVAGVARDAIPAPDRAAIVAAVERYGEASQDVGFGKGSGGWFDGVKTPALDAAKAALLALVGIGES